MMRVLVVCLGMDDKTRMRHNVVPKRFHRIAESKFVMINEMCVYGFYGINSRSSDMGLQNVPCTVLDGYTVTSDCRFNRFKVCMCNYDKTCEILL